MLVALPIWISDAFRIPVPPYSHQADTLLRLSQYLPVCALVGYFMAKSPQSWKHFGLSKNLDVWGIATFLAGLVVVGLFSVWLADILTQATSLQPVYDNLGPLPRTIGEWLWMWPILLIGAAFEELVFRGFMTARMFDITQSRALSILVPAAIFGSIHLYQGWPQAIGAGVYGALFGFLFLQWRRLKALILAHFAYNLWVFYSFII